MDCAARREESDASIASSRISPERASALDYYLSPTSETVDECSVYSLWPEEKYLLSRYLRTGDRIADLACGMGRTTLCLHEMGYAIVGMDLSEALIRAARKRFPYLDLRVASFTDIPEPNESFSLALISGNAVDLAYPVSERITALRECARILKPHGTLIFSSHNLKSLHLISPCYWRRPVWKIRHALKAFRPVAHIAAHSAEAGLHGLFVSPEEVIRQCEAEGFKFLEMVGMGVSKRRLNMNLRSVYIHYAFQKN
jgi:ubiquinone/menaquinone biosynthesis C-methylase UbiE